MAPNPAGWGLTLPVMRSSSKVDWKSISMGTAPSRPRNLQLMTPCPLFSICIRVTSCTGTGHIRGCRDPLWCARCSVALPSVVGNPNCHRLGALMALLQVNG